MFRRPGGRLGKLRSPTGRRARVDRTDPAGHAARCAVSTADAGVSVGGPRSRIAGKPGRPIHGDERGSNCANRPLGQAKRPFPLLRPPGRSLRIRYILSTQRKPRSGEGGPTASRPPHRGHRLPAPTARSHRLRGDRLPWVDDQLPGPGGDDLLPGVDDVDTRTASTRGHRVRWPNARTPTRGAPEPPQLVRPRPTATAGGVPWRPLPASRRDPAHAPQNLPIGLFRTAPRDAPATTAPATPRIRAFSRQHTNKPNGSHSPKPTRRPEKTRFR